MRLWSEDTSLPRSRPLRGGGEAGDFPPGVDASAPRLAIGGGSPSLPPRSAVGDEGTLG